MLTVPSRVENQRELKHMKSSMNIQAEFEERSAEHAVEMYERAQKANRKRQTQVIKSKAREERKTNREKAEETLQTYKTNASEERIAYKLRSDAEVRVTGLGLGHGWSFLVLGFQVRYMRVHECT